jgi:HEAT repeat protein
MHVDRTPLISSLALSLLLAVVTGGPLRAQSHHHQDYDDVDPWAGVTPAETGPDSTTVANFLRSLETSDPLLCQFVVHNLGNNWSHQDGRYRTGNLEAEETHEAARQRLSRPVTDPAALAHLGQSLGNQHACVRRAAARMLGQSQREQALRLLLEALRHEETRVREAAALGLADAENPAAFHDLTRALRDRDQAVVRMTAYALGELEDARAVKPLGELLGAADARTRAAAADALGEIEDIRATGRLGRLVSDADPGVRMAAVRALGEIEDHRAAGALAEALRDKTVAVRREAAEALGEVESPKAAPARALRSDSSAHCTRRRAPGHRRLGPRGDRRPGRASSAEHRLSQ